MTLCDIKTTRRQPSWLPFGFVPRWRLAAALVVLAVLCGGAPIVEAADGELVIMAVDSSRLPEAQSASGQSAPRPVGEGAEEVAGEIARRGGLLGRPIRVAKEDDRCDAGEAAAIAERAVAQGVHLVIGHVCASGAIRAAEIYAAAGIVMIATGPRHPRLTGTLGRRGIHRLAGRDDRQADSIAALIAAKFPTARAAIVHDRSLQGRGMGEELRRSLTAAQVVPVLVASYTSGIKDHAVLVGELVAAKADLVVFPGQLFEASMILDQADRAGARVATAIGADVLAADDPPARLLGAVDSFLVMLPWPGAGAKEAEATMDATARRLAAVALEAWAAAAEDAGSVAAEAVIAALKGTARSTRIGPMHFDAKGDAVVPAFVPHVWARGRWQSSR